MEELGLVRGVGAKTFKVLCEHFEVPEEEARKRSPHDRHLLLSAQLTQALPPPQLIDSEQREELTHDAHDV
jgi:hypothetical protein